MEHPSSARLFGDDVQQVLRADPGEPPDTWGICADEPAVDLVDLSNGRTWRRSHSRAADPMCEACPVYDECLLWASTHPEVGGIWAGTTSREERLALSLPRGWIPTGRPA